MLVAFGTLRLWPIQHVEKEKVDLGVWGPSTQQSPFLWQQVNEVVADAGR